MYFRVAQIIALCEYRTHYTLHYVKRQGNQLKHYAIPIIPLRRQCIKKVNRIYTTFLTRELHYIFQYHLSLNMLLYLLILFSFAILIHNNLIVFNIVSPHETHEKTIWLHSILIYEKQIHLTQLALLPLP